MSTVTPALRRTALRGQLAGLSLLERLGLAVSDARDIDETEELAILLHDTSCDCGGGAGDTCREFRDRRFHRWAWELHETIEERLSTASAA